MLYLTFEFHHMIQTKEMPCPFSVLVVCTVGVKDCSPEIDRFKIFEAGSNKEFELNEIVKVLAPAAYEEILTRANYKSMDALLESAKESE